MNKKEEKALEYAKEVWGDYFDNEYPERGVEKNYGEITQQDYLAGYEQGLKDAKAKETKLIEMLNKCKDYFKNIDNNYHNIIEQLIKELENGV